MQVQTSHRLQRCGVGSIGKPSRRSSQSNCSKGVYFDKYHGLGNDFILVDNRTAVEPVITSADAERVCDRRFGAGADGVIFAMPPENGGDFSMRIFNSDGSEPEMCGNGIRCLAKFIGEKDGIGGTMKVSTLAGLILPTMLDDGRVRVDMGTPILSPADIPTTLEATKDGAVVAHKLQLDGDEYTVTCVSMGNPHAVVYSRNGGPVPTNDIDLPKTGPLFEHHEVFPARINTEFVEVLSPSHVRMVVWERGAGATLACGTGACALVVAGVLEGRIERTCRVDLPGGPLDIEWDQESNRLFMTGPAEKVYSGVLSM